MPIVYDKNYYNTLYRVPALDGSGPTGYTRNAVVTPEGEVVGWSKNHLERVERTAEQALNLLDIIVVGCGFGWSMEPMLDRGINVVGVDPSPYVHAERDTHSRSDVTILDATVGVDDVVSLLSAQGLDTGYNMVIDEDAASSHSDAELDDFFTGLEELRRPGGRVIHIVTPKMEDRRQDTSINWKTVQEWKSLAPAHTWIGTNGVIR